MDKKGGDKKDPKAAAGKGTGKDAKPAKEAPKQEKKEEKKEETAEDRRLREEREEAKAEKKLHKKEHQKHMHEAHAAGGNIMDDLGKKQIFKKFSYRGNDLKKLIDMNMDEMSQQLRSRQRRKLRRKWEVNTQDLLTNYSKLKNIQQLEINLPQLNPI